MKVLIASHNPGKIERFGNLLKDSEGLHIVSLQDEGISEYSDEPFFTSQENAAHKAITYADRSGFITLAIDDAALTNFLPDDEQPGVFLRRYTHDKRELNDEQIVAVWKEILSQYPQDDKQFIWHSTIACYHPHYRDLKIIPVNIISYVVNFSPIIQPGYPMGSFLSPVPGGKPYSELTQKEKYAHDARIYGGFVEEFLAWLQHFPH